jgi:hypothetical protein
MQKRAAVVLVKKSKIGLGAFAARNFRKHQTIGEVTGCFILGDDYDPHYSVDMGDAGSLDPDAPFRYLNHSCDPNCQLIEWTNYNYRDGRPRLWVWSLRTIRIGEELTIDYAWPAEDLVRCRCGSHKCRGWIVDKRELKLLPKWARQERYDQTERALRPKLRRRTDCAAQ